MLRPALLAAGLLGPALLAPLSARALEVRRDTSLDALVSLHAQANGVPEELVHRVIRRESRYNPRAVGRGGAMGLMQIKTGTARALGYAGGPSGLLDAETNLKYAVRYLAGAYKVAGGDQARAVGYFARGYYYEAKRQGLHRPGLHRTLAAKPGAEAEAPVEVQAETVAAATPATATVVATGSLADLLATPIEQMPDPAGRN